MVPAPALDPRRDSTGGEGSARDDPRPPASTRDLRRDSTSGKGGAKRAPSPFAALDLRRNATVGEGSARLDPPPTSAVARNLRRGSSTGGEGGARLDLRRYSTSGEAGASGNPSPTSILDLRRDSSTGGEGDRAPRPLKRMFSFGSQRSLASTLSMDNVQNVYGKAYLFWVHVAISLCVFIAGAAAWSVIAEVNAASATTWLSVLLVYAAVVARACAPADRVSSYQFVAIDVGLVVLGVWWGLSRFFVAAGNDELLLANLAFAFLSVMNICSLIAVTSVPSSAGRRTQLWFLFRISLGLLDTTSDFAIGIQLLQQAAASPSGWLICIFGAVDTVFLAVKVALPYQRLPLTRLYMPIVGVIAEAPVLYVSAEWIVSGGDQDFALGVLSVATTSASIVIHAGLALWEVRRARLESKRPLGKSGGRSGQRVGRHRRQDAKTTADIEFIRRSSESAQRVPLFERGARSSLSMPSARNSVCLSGARPSFSMSDVHSSLCSTGARSSLSMPSARNSVCSTDARSSLSMPSARKPFCSTGARSSLSVRQKPLPFSHGSSCISETYSIASASGLSPTVAPSDSPPSVTSPSAVTGSGSLLAMTSPSTVAGSGSQPSVTSPSLAASPASLPAHVDTGARPASPSRPGVVDVDATPQSSNLATRPSTNPFEHISPCVRSHPYAGRRSSVPFQASSTTACGCRTSRVQPCHAESERMSSLTTSRAHHHGHRSISSRLEVGFSSSSTTGRIRVNSPSSPSIAQVFPSSGERPSHQKLVSLSSAAARMHVNSPSSPSVTQAFPSSSTRPNHQNRPSSSSTTGRTHASSPSRRSSAQVPPLPSVVQVFSPSSEHPSHSNRPSSSSTPVRVRVNSLPVFSSSSKRPRHQKLPSSPSATVCVPSSRRPRHLRRSAFGFEPNTLKALERSCLHDSSSIGLDVSDVGTLRAPSGANQEYSEVV